VIETTALEKFGLLGRELSHADQWQLLAMISATTTQKAQIIKTPRKNLIFGLGAISHVPASSPSTRHFADERAL
jgi:hypothetical protein